MYMEEYDMKICVCGWYYFDSIYRDLEEVNKTYPVFIVAHKPDPKLNGFEWKERENTGLEWGAYDWYLKNEWDGESDILFMHDDVRMRPIFSEYETVPVTQIFRAIEKLADEYDQVYIFRSLDEKKKNFGLHGRAFLATARLLRYLLDNHDGIWYDADNTGHTMGPTPEWCKHYNEADYRFRDVLIKIDTLETGMSLNNSIILPPFDCARRGKFEEERQYPI